MHNRSWLGGFIVGALLLAVLFTEFEWHTTVFKGNFVLCKVALDEGTFRIDDYRALVGYDQGYYDGHYYVPKAIGVALLYAPVYALLVKPVVWGAGWFGVDNWDYLLPQAWFTHIVTLLGVLALGLWSIWRTLEILAPGSKVLPFAMLIFGATLFLPYSTYPVSEIFSVSLIFTGLYFLLRPQTPRNLALSGTAYAFLWLVCNQASLMAVVAFLYLIACRTKLRALVAFCSPIAASIVLHLVYNWYNFDDPLSFPTWHFYANGDITRPRMAEYVTYRWPELKEYYGQFIHHRDGIFFYTPLFVLAVPGFVALFRRERLSGLLILGSFLAALGFFSVFSDWKAGADAGFRYFVPYMSYLAIAAAYRLVVVPIRFETWLLIVPSVMVSVLLTFTSVWQPNLEHPIRDYAWKILREEGPRNLLTSLAPDSLRHSKLFAYGSTAAILTATVAASLLVAYGGTKRFPIARSKSVRTPSPAEAHRAAP